MSLTRARHAARLSRRGFLILTGSTALGAARGLPLLLGGEAAADPHGCVVGQPAGEEAGMRVLRDGGTAVDAVVAAALAAAVAAPSSAGIGGYGMSAIFAVDGGRRIVAVDGNSTAPSALRADAFAPGPDGLVPGKFNEVGWLAAGVPGVLAGLQLALDRFGTRSFAELVQPAIAIARDGFRWPAGLAATVRGHRHLPRDAGSRALFFPGGEPIPAGSLFKNPELAELLVTLAKSDSVEAFYRGEIAGCIADAFHKNGGLVTAQDMAAHRARLVEPLTMDWGGYRIHTAPLTAGGLSVLQMLRAMRAMKWEEMPEGLPRTVARIELARLAWRDRLTLLGDPDCVDVPIVRLLSEEYARESAARVTAAVKAGRILEHAVTASSQTGTIHLSAADQHGQFAALTLTHGNGFGACVTVEGLGLTLGHGMSRFNPRPGHPNAPGPGKRPLHNMVPTLVTRDGQPVLAIGGTGGRKIPNAMLELLTQFVVLDMPLEAAISAPRFHTEGQATLSLEKAWPAADANELRRVGYSVKTEGSANISAVAREDGTLSKARR